MLSVLTSPSDLLRELGSRVRALRLARAWTQAELAERSGVALSTLKLFERTGQISLERLILLGRVLDAMDAFDALFAPQPARSLAELERQQQPRKRGRRRP